MEKDKWIYRMKERMEQHSETLPPDGWERLEQTLSAQEGAGITIPLRVRRWRWAVAVAVVLLTAVSGIGWWLLQTAAVEDMLDVQLPVADLTPDVLPESPAPDVPVSYASKQTVRINRRAAIPSVVPEENSMTITADTVWPDCELPEQASGVELAETETFSDSLVTPRKTTLDDVNPLPEVEETTRKRGRWTFGLLVTNAVEKKKNLLGDGVLAAEPGLNGGNKTEEEEDKDGTTTRSLPATRTASKPERMVRSANHKQPISFGLSVRRNLKHGFSLETGLVYTYLASDVTFKGVFYPDGEQHLHYLGIPIRANWNFVDRQSFVAYLSAGGMVEKCIWGTLGGDKYIVDPLQFSVMASVGVQYNISQRVGIYVEPGFSYFFDDGSEAVTIRKENPRNFTLQGGIRLTY